jgi:hypothetical protein
MSLTLCSTRTVDETRTWKEVQKLVPCRRLLQQCCEEYDARHAVRVEVDERAFAIAFFAWLDVIEHNEPYRVHNPVDYFHFAFGVLLRELLHEKAVRIGGAAMPPMRPAPADIADWWPVGYVLTYFCIGTLKQAAREECGVELRTAEAVQQPQAWQAFRENLVEEPGLAIAYLDRFMGLEPNWREPNQIINRPSAHSFSKTTA